jgi:hypothetical protein
MSRPTLVLLCALLVGCAVDQAVESPLTQRFVWFSFLNGDDIRENCFPGSLWRYRLVYNGRYQEQLRRYEVVADGAGGAYLVSRVQGSANLASVTLNDVMAPWRWWRAETRLSPGAVAEFEAALEQSGFFGPPAVGLRLPSAGFYWLAVGCREGTVYLNAWRHPSARFAALEFPAFLFARDGTGVDVNPPRQIDAAELTFQGARPAAQRQRRKFWLTVSKDGLQGLRRARGTRAGQPQG